MSIKTVLGWVIAVTLCTGVGAVGYRPASAATTYSISNLSGLTTASFAYGSSANRSKIAGRTLVSPNQRAYVHSGGAMTTLGPVQGFTHTQAFDVNDSGQVAGIAGNVSVFGFDSAERAFVFDGISMTQLPTLAGPGSTHAYAINNAGTVAGKSGGNTPFKFQIGAAVLTPLTFPAGGFGAGKAFDINTAGDIVGFEFMTLTLPDRRPIVWRNGVTPTALAMPAGTTYAEAKIINDAGVIAGLALYGTSTRGFYYNSSGTPIDMGALGANFVSTELFDINNAFQAIGTQFNISNLSTSPFLYSGGTMVNLNTLLPAGSGWVLQRPISINDLGEIVGVGTFNGTPSAFRLTPVPEPVALAGIIGMTGLAVIGRRRAGRNGT